ncbi:MAG: tRNA pseudouridine(55) synthase TruB [Elusimicrobia bacterium]|nr:tRNA pseudouridine(55) synthase TruB [Elusimicrobiota bacterium]
MDGILNVYKPAGITSYDVIRHIKRTMRREDLISLSKIGHAGTLDPFAEGVLLILLGKATKLSGQLMDMPKVYRGTIALGEERDTDDLTGKVRKVSKVNKVIKVREDDFQRIAESFLGEIEQEPPVYSALHWGGKRLYELARRGQMVQPLARKVQVYEFKIIEPCSPFSLCSPSFSFEAKVGKGCYIRALARDFGRALGTGAYLASLTRVSVGPYHCDDGLRLQDISKNLMASVNYA